MIIFSKTLSNARKDSSYVSYIKAHSFAKKNITKTSSYLPVKIAILRNFTIEPMLPALEVELLLSKIAGNFYISNFDNILSEVTNPNSKLYASNSEIIILAQWLETLLPSLTKRFLNLSSDEVNIEIKNLFSLIDLQISSIRKNSNAIILINNFPPFAETTLGILESQKNIFYKGAVQSINSFIHSLHEKYENTFIIDYQATFYNHGFQQLYDYKSWQTSRLPFTGNGLVAIAKFYSKMITSLKGRSKKCLVLDCDNTLWGGVIGEDGLNSIKLATDGPGASYYDFQKEILNLHDRGIILALCSKNNESDVFEVLANHPQMLIRKEHLAIWRINWNDKASNIKEIAQSLNIGLDSVVFVDDSAFECEYVKEQIPEVEVIQLSGRPPFYCHELLKDGFFDSLSFTNEDSVKNKQYQIESQRKVFQAETTSMDDFLKRLDLVASLGSPKEIDIPRISQLTQKTNQYNLTTKRYTEDEIRNFVKKDNYDVFCLKLKDKFSDMGLIAIAILKHSENESVIDSFLMSCRAIGRGVEDALMYHITNQAKIRGTKVLIGTYTPTQKNEQVINFYEKYGFIKTDTSDNLKTTWQINIGNWNNAPPEWIKFELT